MNYIFPIAVFATIAIVLAIASFTNFELDNHHYDRLKWVVIRWSYFTTFIGLIVKTFNVPYGTETVILVAGLGAALAGFLGISKKNWDGEYLEEDEDEIDDEEELEEGDEDGTSE